MKFTKLVSAFATIAALGALSAPAHALTVLDGWKLVTAAGTTSNIGRLNLVSGTAQVTQEVNASNNVFVGARFSETGQIFSVTYTPENTVGPNDSGAPALLAGGQLLTIAFSNTTGVIDQLIGSGAHFVYTGGTFTISSSAGGSASGSILGLDGTLGSSSTISGTTGATTLLGNILSKVGIFDFQNSAGVSLLPALASGQAFFEVTTNNAITAPTNFNAACGFTPGAGNHCVTLTASSAGDAYLTTVPEPGTLAIVGLSLAAMGLIGRRRKSV